MGNGKGWLYRKGREERGGLEKGRRSGGDEGKG